VGILGAQALVVWMAFQVAGSLWMRPVPAKVTAFRVDARELPGDWVAVDEHILPAAQANLVNCLPDEPGGAVSDVWYSTMAFEQVDSLFRSGLVNISTARFVDGDGLAATRARLAGDCPAISTSAIEAAAPGVWDRWQPEFSGADAWIDTPGVEHATSVVECSWTRTAVTDDDLRLIVMTAPDTVVALNGDGDEANPFDHRAGDSTWGHSWCAIRDEPQVVVSLSTSRSLIGADEMWQLCGAVVPQIRRNVRQR
jgi:hypothetical protein